MSLDDSDLDDAEWPEGDDAGFDAHADASNDDLPEMACPSCGGAVVEDTQKCPHCGDWITPREPGGGGKGVLFIAAVALMLLIVLMWIVR